jgi:biopolymer transport protein ExbB
MRKIYGRGVVVLAAARARTLFLVLGLSLLGPGSLRDAPALAQERDRGSGAAAAPTNAGVATGGGSGGVESSISTEADAQGGPSRSDARESSSAWMDRAWGPVVVVTIVIAAMSFYLIALIIWMALRFRTTTAVPSELVRDVQELLEQAKYHEAYHRLVQDSSFLARVLAAGVRKLPAGFVRAQRALELANEDATMQMEHRTTYLATVGTLGPMIGLVGTVYGMIMAFRVIAVEGATPQASQLAAGIATALYATLEGIALSIPAIYFYAVCRNRIARLSLEVGMTAEPLLEQFAPGVRMAASASPSPGPAPPPSPSTHAHPFAVSAALAAAAANATRPALPPAAGGLASWDEDG